MHHRTRHRAAIGTYLDVPACSHTALSSAHSVRDALNLHQAGDGSELIHDSSTVTSVNRFEQQLQTGLPHALPPLPKPGRIVLIPQGGLHLVQAPQLGLFDLGAASSQQPGNRLPYRRPRVRSRCLHHGHPASRRNG
ncbi:hypothetical protein [Streptomyces sp. NPDC001975]